MYPDLWKIVSDREIISDEEIWSLRYTLRRELVEFARKQLRGQYQRVGGDGARIFEKILSPDALTIGFARRFATYKRAPLIFRDMAKAVSLFNNPERPVQLLFSGKAHPRDDKGKEFIQQIQEITKRNDFFGKVVFLENYDINVARHLISGADVWLNTPRRPQEASGTSGQKVAVHGGLNLGVLDGWWREGFDGSNGWAIGEDASADDPEAQDVADADSLYQALFDHVIPLFFNRDDQGIPRGWIEKVRRSMQTLIPIYNTDRMVAEYVTKYYLSKKLVLKS
jgi:starch phosphorylase